MQINSIKFRSPGSHKPSRPCRLRADVDGPQNHCSCPELGGTREGAEPLPEQPRVQRRRKCETSPPPQPRRKARPSRSHPGAPALEGRSSYLGAPLSPGTRKKNQGGNPRPGGTGGSGRTLQLAFAQEAPGPKFPEPAAHSTLYMTWPQARPNQWPRATASPFSWDPCHSASLNHRPRSSPSAMPTYSLCGVGSAMLS